MNCLFSCPYSHFCHSRLTLSLKPTDATRFSILHPTHSSITLLRSASTSSHSIKIYPVTYIRTHIWNNNKSIPVVRCTVSTEIVPLHFVKLFSWNEFRTPAIHNNFHRYTRYQTNHREAGACFLQWVIQERPTEKNKINWLQNCQWHLRSKSFYSNADIHRCFYITVCHC